MEQLPRPLEYVWSRILSQHASFSARFQVGQLIERAMGIEPTCEAWEGFPRAGCTHSWNCQAEAWHDKAQALDVLGPVEVGGALSATVGFA